MANNNYNDGWDYQDKGKRDGFSNNSQQRTEGRTPRPRFSRNVNRANDNSRPYSNGPRTTFGNPRRQDGQRGYNRSGEYQGGNFSRRSFGHGSGEYGEERGNYGYQRQGYGFNGEGKYNRNNQQRRPGYHPDNKYSHKKQIKYKEENFDPSQPIRLNKFLANAGICSRRDADKYIEAGVVSVNGEIVTELGTRVLRTDEVRFHDEPVKIEKKVYVLLNKPKGFVTTSDDPQNRKTVMDLVKNACPERIYPIGRLDRNTTGVLLLTNDGELSTRLTHPKYLKKKIYHVHLDKGLSYGDMQKIAEGIMLEDGEIKADDIQYTNENDKKQVGIEIHSGRNRIVRRIFEALGYRVLKLDRVFFAGLTKKNVKRGDWRFLTQEEVNFLKMGSFE